MFSKRVRDTNWHNCMYTIDTLGSAMLAHFIPKTAIFSPTDVPVLQQQSKLRKACR